MKTSDTAAALERALLSLEGLSVGDGFGECFLSGTVSLYDAAKRLEPPPGPWAVTDDTVMALSIVRCLKQRGTIDQDALAAAFAEAYRREPFRGYGRGAHAILSAIGRGEPWRSVSSGAFGGQGSCGNGGAMRAAPIGAFFADDLERVIAEAKASAEVTHFHPDGQTGAVAVALAAAYVARHPRPQTAPDPHLIPFVLEHLPKTETHERLLKALEMPFTESPLNAGVELGNGVLVTASDTVPFCLWCAARHPGSYTDALWTTVSGFGDIDTTCAIVGGIVSLGVGRDGIPASWLSAREPIAV